MSDVNGLNGGDPVSSAQGVMPGVQPALTPQQVAAQQRQTIFGQETGQLPSTLTVPNGTNGNGEQRMFTAADIEAARQQEKEKLYGRLTKVDEMVADLAALKAERDAAAARAQEEAAARAEAERKAAEESMDVRTLIAKKDEEWTQRLKEEERRREVAEAMLERDRQVGVLSDYRARRLAEEEMNILPEIARYIPIGTEEEIEAAIAVAKNDTASIMQGVQQFQMQTRQRLTGVSPTGSAPLGPMETQQETRQFTKADIDAMPMAEYMKLRGPLRQAATQQFYGQR